MKRRLPVGAGSGASASSPKADPLVVSVILDKRGGTIHPLHEDPTLQTLTPRSLAKSVAELDALRSRVQELEQRLSQHEVETLPVTKSTKKLPPLLPETTGMTMSEMSPGAGRVIGTIGFIPAPAIERIASAPELLTRRQMPSPITSPSKSSSKPLVEINDQRDHPPQAIGLEIATGDDQQVAFEDSNPPSPTSSVISTSSPNREQAKIVLEHDGDTVFAISQRNRLYQILKRISATTAIKEDDLVLLKKLVDAEIGDVIKFLLSVESEESTSVLDKRVHEFLQTGSPAKHHARTRVEFPRQHPVWGIQYPLQKIARNLEHLKSGAATNNAATISPKLDVIVLVSSGAYNPIHMLHIRAFYVARQYVESNYKFPVVGAFISPSHDTFVRVKNRRKPHEMIPKRHRLAIIEAAVASSSWIEVDKWEITRRRVLDYLSTLTHVREMCETHFRDFKFHVMYVCGCNTVVKLSHSALRDEGFGCITVCRPTQTEMVVKHLGKTLAKSTTIVEDTGVLPIDLEQATSFRVRQAMMAKHWEDKLPSLEMMVGKPVLQYLLKHSIPHKVSGREPWHDEDKSWRDIDLAYVEYIES